MSTQFNCQKYFYFKLFSYLLTVKWLQVLVQQFNSTMFKWSSSSIRLIDRILSGATISGQCGPGSNGNEEVPHIPQSTRAGASPSDCLVPYLGHLLRGAYLFAVMHSVYSATPTDFFCKQTQCGMGKGGEAE